MIETRRLKNVIRFVFHVVPPRLGDNLGVEFLLFSCKNNQEEWMETEAYLEPS